MALPNEPIVKKFFTNKIESTRDDWYGYLVKIAHIFYTLDGKEYDREILLSKFASMSGRDASQAQRDASNFRDEFGAYGTYLGIYHLEQVDGKWCIIVSEAAKKFLCCENPNAAAFCRAQLALFQYPNGAGFGISANGGQSVQGNIKADTYREIQNNIRLNPFRLVCRIVVSQVEIKQKKFSEISIPYSALFCMVNDDRINRQYSPSLEQIASVFDEYCNADNSVNMNLDGLNNFKRNFHIFEKTGLFTRDSRFGLLLAQSNYTAVYSCIKTIANMDSHFDAFDDLYNAPTEDAVRDVIASPQWGIYYDAANLSATTLEALGVEMGSAPIKTFLTVHDFNSSSNDTMVDNEKTFKEWLSKQRKSNGERYSDNTRSQYISAVKSAATEFEEELYPYSSIFNIDDVDTLDGIIVDIKSNTKFDSINKARGNGALSACLDLYHRFLSEHIVSEPCFLSPEWFKMKSAEYPQVDAEANALYQKFQEQYAPEILRNLSDEELLGYIFLGVGDTSLCNALEFDPQYNQFGSIAGGTSYKYSLFYSRNSHAWKTSFGEGGQRSISDDEALDIGKQIRDALVTGADIIGSWESLSTVNDYNELLTALNAAIPQYITKMWFLKYYHMIFPELIPNFYNASWHRHILCSLNIVPSDVQFIRMGQINCFVKECGISNIMFGHIVPDSIGMPKTFFRIGTGENGAYFDDWYEKNYVAIGWNELGDLSTVYQDDADSKAVIVDALRSHWNYDTRLASRKYGEINNFYSAVVEDTYVVAMSGQKILAIGTFSGSYYFDEDKEYGHCRAVRWLKVFGEKKKLPNESEGMRTTFYELKDSENLCYLYSLLYGADEKEDSSEQKDETGGKPTEEKMPIRFNTGFSSSFPRNRILFGAPGTGKSYTLNHEKDILLTEGGEYERVTFHPDYSYANFVGTYKPVPCKDSEGKDAITYKYVPGPFMRTYVKALENSRSDDVKPFLLIIEEINRANVAAVFGDVFQLLDRNDDETSEYPIQASEDIKTYLSDTLELSPDECTEICLPDNMFIWATMNSADQGVFPMDTAFKRRWDFTYLGIDDSDQDIRGKYVLLADDKSQKVEWNKLRRAINHFLQKEKINEDKQLGPYFISRNIIVPPTGDEIDRDRFIHTFKNKVIMYLFEDAAKQKRSKLFEGCFQNSSRYSEICREFEEKGIGIFHHDIQVEAEPEDAMPHETPEE